MNIPQFKRLPILGILRGISHELLEPLLEKVVQSGLQTIEITMNTPGAAQLIQRAVQHSQGRLVIGAGTVLTKNDLKEALDAGATFIVMPVVIEEIIDACLQEKIPVFPGAFSPQDIYRAWQAGATMVKVFPARVLGPVYFKEVKGPFQDVELLACGGVTPENLEEYFKNGASAITFGSSVFRREWLNNREGLEAVGQRIKQYIHRYLSFDPILNR